jgi:hypothetical protein
MNDVPVFALLGHPNEGKSSVVSTLTEEDRVPISALPGETRECANYAIVVDGKTLLRFVDTPGFQMPLQTLSWMKQYSGPPERMIEAFISTHQEDPRFDDDCELLRPVAKNAGIIYVVDGSRPLRSNDEAEMEILRLSGRPRMAVLNPKASETANIPHWKSAFAKTFNVNLHFNAHRATFKERMELLQALQPIEQDWTPAITKAVEVLKENWNDRLEACADSILVLLKEVLTLSLSSTSAGSDQGEQDQQREELKSLFLEKVSRIERQCHRELKSRFLHNVFDVDLASETIVAEDLYSEETWKVLGATHAQLIVSSIATGALSGAGLDLFFANLTFGVFTAIGGVFGGFAGWKGVRPLARFKAKVGPFAKDLGGYSITVGPVRNPQLLFVLLDRALIYFQCVSNWAHARRGAETISPLHDKEGFVARWEREKRKAFEAYLVSLQENRLDKVEKLRPKLRQILVQAMRNA